MKCTGHKPSRINNGHLWYLESSTHLSTLLQILGQDFRSLNLFLWQRCLSWWKIITPLCHGQTHSTHKHCNGKPVSLDEFQCSSSWTRSFWTVSFKCTPYSWRYPVFPKAPVRKDTPITTQHFWQACHWKSLAGNAEFQTTGETECKSEWEQKVALWKAFKGIQTWT